MNAEQQEQFLNQFQSWSRMQRSTTEFVKQRDNAEKAARYDEAVAKFGEILHYDPELVALAYSTFATLCDIAAHENLEERDWVWLKETIKGYREDESKKHRSA